MPLFLLQLSRLQSSRKAAEQVQALASAGLTVERALSGPPLDPAKAQQLVRADQRLLRRKAERADIWAGEGEGGGDSRSAGSGSTRGGPLRRGGAAPTAPPAPAPDKWTLLEELEHDRDLLRRSLTRSLRHPWEKEREEGEEKEEEFIDGRTGEYVDKDGRPL